MRYEVFYRKVKYPRLELKTGSCQIILPPGKNPEEVLSRHKAWLEKKEAFIQESLKLAKKESLVKRDVATLKKMVSFLIKEVGKELKVSVNKTFLRKMKTKWASCSRKGNLTINTLMRFLPRNLIRYIIFHELAHLIERRHNERFWQIIERRFPHYHQLEKKLFAYWFLLQKISRV